MRGGGGGGGGGGAEHCCANRYSNPQTLDIPLFTATDNILVDIRMSSTALDYTGLDWIILHAFINYSIAFFCIDLDL